MPRAGRNQDERLLEMVRARASGKSLGTMEKLFGVSNASLSTQTNKVMDADIAESGEPISAVSSHYWPRKK